MRLEELLNQPTLDLKEICAHLDALEGPRRIAETVALTGAQQARLYDAALGFRAMTLLDLVPATVPPMTGVPHEGRNSLLAFRFFAKVFYRPEEPSLRELWGYNRTSELVSTTVGPGYYVASEKGGGELLVDYTRQPPTDLPGAPAMLPNSARLSFFVYNQTQDTLRGVSRHVCIGRASRHGRDLDNWFVLCRAD